ncbi:MAG TPA: cytochrome C [Hyphomicrobiaceae bacterium]|jgi:cytochrome c553|nr:cytochrome C [Hyphomicrobiaceae bacterium]
MHAVRLFAAVVVAVSWVGAALSAPPEAPPGASSCSGCHAAKPGVETLVPPLAGRPAADIVAQMQAFKSGQRPATVMDRIAKGLADAEVEAIAAWYAQQK